MGLGVKSDAERFTLTRAAVEDAGRIRAGRHFVTQGSLVAHFFYFQSIVFRGVDQLTRIAFVGNKKFASRFAAENLLIGLFLLKLHSVATVCWL